VGGPHSAASALTVACLAVMGENFDPAGGKVRYGPPLEPDTRGYLNIREPFSWLGGAKDNERFGDLWTGRPSAAAVSRRLAC